MEKSKFLKVLYIILSILFVLSSIMTTVLILSFDKDYASPKFGDLILVSVNDSELSPKVLKGSALLADLKYDQVQTGDYVIITSKNSKGVEYTPRRVKNVDQEYYTVEGTEGRGSFYIAKSGVIAVSRMQFYGLGAYMNTMRTQAGFFGFVIVPLVIIIMVQIIRMVSLVQEKRFKEKYTLEPQNNNDKEPDNEVKK